MINQNSYGRSQVELHNEIMKLFSKPDSKHSKDFDNREVSERKLFDEDAEVIIENDEDNNQTRSGCRQSRQTEILEDVVTMDDVASNINDDVLNSNPPLEDITLSDTQIMEETIFSDKKSKNDAVKGGNDVSEIVDAILDGGSKEDDSTAELNDPDNLNEDESKPKTENADEEQIPTSEKQPDEIFSGGNEEEMFDNIYESKIADEDEEEKIDLNALLNKQENDDIDTEELFDNVYESKNGENDIDSDSSTSDSSSSDESSDSDLDSDSSDESSEDSSNDGSDEESEEKHKPKKYKSLKLLKIIDEMHSPQKNVSKKFDNNISGGTVGVRKVRIINSYPYVLRSSV